MIQKLKKKVLIVKKISPFAAAKIFIRFVYVLALSILLAFLLVATKYSPDAYVFIRWIAHDNIARNISFNSILNNNFLFDASTVVFDRIGITTLFGYLTAVVIFYLAVFYLKYFHFCRDLNLSKISLIFVASLMTYDLNQLRFNLSTLILLYSFSTSIGIKARMLLRCISLGAHILPILVYYIARLYYLPLLILPFLVPFLLGSDSRFKFYVTSEDFIFFKVFLLFIPNLITHWHYKRSHHKSKIADYALSFNILFLILLGVNGALAARFVEGSFYLYVLWWCLADCRSKVLTTILWFFSLSMLTSRLFNGISAGDQGFFFTLP